MKFFRKSETGKKGDAENENQEPNAVDLLQSRIDAAKASDDFYNEGGLERASNKELLNEFMRKMDEVEHARVSDDGGADADHLYQQLHHQMWRVRGEIVSRMDPAKNKDAGEIGAHYTQ